MINNRFFHNNANNVKGKETEGVFSYILLIMLLQLPHFPPHLYSPPPCTPPPTHISPPLQFMSLGLTYKFFGFYISYTIPNLPLSIFYLPFMLLILCTFPPFLSLSTPLLITLHVTSISVILFLFQFFAQFVFVFVFVLGSVVNNCEFVVILLFIVFDLLFLR